LRERACHDGYESSFSGPNVLLHLGANPLLLNNPGILLVSPLEAV
jgi:hypothetical protein